MAVLGVAVSREIKFRTWFKGDEPFEESWEKPKMIYDVQSLYDGSIPELGAYGSFGGLLENDDFVVMQFTGLRDKNGKEIYEGDILEIEDFRGVHIREQSSKDGPFRGRVGVEWREMDASFILNKNNPFNDAVKKKCGQEQYDRDLPYIWDLGNVQDPVVIGNIYENPELLK